MTIDEKALDVAIEVLHQKTLEAVEAYEAAKQQPSPHVGTASPKRESGYAAGALLISNDPDFPGWLVAVPLEQMKDIKERFKKLIALGQTHHKAFDTQPAGVTDLKRSVFAIAEMGCLHAGNWTQKQPPSPPVPDDATKDLRTRFELARDQFVILNAYLCSHGMQDLDSEQYMFRIALSERMSLACKELEEAIELLPLPKPPEKGLK